jgi:hypothetical protein
MPDVLRPEDFRGLDGPLLVEAAATAPAAEVALTVESVDALPAHRMREAPFSLALRGPQAPALAQGTYLVGHPRLGHVRLFLVPIAQDAQGMRYEVTFN